MNSTCYIETKSYQKAGISMQYCMNNPYWDTWGKYNKISLKKPECLNLRSGSIEQLVMQVNFF